MIAQRSNKNLICTVILLTLFNLICSSCSPTLVYESAERQAKKIKNILIKPICKNRAFISADLNNFLSKRFPMKSPVRMGIIPFSVPANLATFNLELPGLDTELARKVQAEILTYEQVPITELFYRLDWPGKKEEFFSGNHGSLSFARQAGYDLTLVGYIEASDAFGKMIVQTKIIEVESGITIKYLQSEIDLSEKRKFNRKSSWFFSDRRPDIILTKTLVEEAAHCIAEGLMEIKD
jgi:hypothetical protein